MSDLESAASAVIGPLIEGEERLLDAGDRQLIDAWAMKTVLML